LTALLLPVQSTFDQPGSYPDNDPSSGLFHARYGFRK